MIKFKVKKQGVYLAVKGDQVEQEIGTVLTLDTKEVPAFLVGKGEIVGDSDGKELVAADELLNHTIAENESLTSQLNAATGAVEALSKDNKGLADKLAKAEKSIEDLTAELADLKKKLAK